MYQKLLKDGSNLSTYELICNKKLKKLLKEKLLLSKLDAEHTFIISEDSVSKLNALRPINIRQKINNNLLLLFPSNVINNGNNCAKILKSLFVKNNTLIGFYTKEKGYFDYVNFKKILATVTNLSENFIEFRLTSSISNFLLSNNYQSLFKKTLKETYFSLNKV